jgi:hypothetical protein
MLRFFFLTVIVLYLLSTLLPGWKLDMVLSALCLAIVACTLPRAKRFVQWLGSSFLLLGIGMLWTSGAGWLDYIRAFGPMLDLVTLFTLVPILGIPIQLGGYGAGIQTLIRRKVKTSGHLYIMTSGISYFFSIFMNLATLPMTYYAMRPALTVFGIKNEERFMSRAITRGFAMPLTWAPVTPIVGIVIGMTGVSWLSILPYVIPLSLMGLGLDWFTGVRRAKRLSRLQQDVTINETAAAIEQDEDGRPGRVVQILWAILLFNIVISMAEGLFSYSFLILVSLLVIPFAFGWSLLLKKGKEFAGSLRDHFRTFSVKMKDQFFLYLSAGFFISAINISRTNEWLNSGMNEFKNAIGIELFLILLPLIPLMFAFIGLHPAVTLALMAEALNPALLGISPQILTVAMLAGAVSAFLVGPYNATIGLMSNLVKENSFKVSNWNLSFTCLYIGCAMVYLLALKLFIA